MLVTRKALPHPGPSLAPRGPDLNLYPPQPVCVTSLPWVPGPGPQAFVPNHRSSSLSTGLTHPLITAEAHTKSLCKDRGRCPAQQPGEPQDTRGPQDFHKRQFLQLPAGRKAMVFSYSFPLELDEKREPVRWRRAERDGLTAGGRAWRHTLEYIRSQCRPCHRGSSSPCPHQEIAHAALSSDDLRNPGSSTRRGGQMPGPAPEPAPASPESECLAPARLFDEGTESAAAGVKDAALESWPGHVTLNRSPRRLRGLWGWKFLSFGDKIAFTSLQ